MNILAFDFAAYFRQLMRNLFYGPDTRYRTHTAHTVWTLSMIFVFPAYQLVIWMMYALDRLTRPAIKKKSVEKPVFIIGSFRSGSTFLQRMMGKDIETFSSGTTWEMMFAPSVSGRKLVRGIFIVDRWFGKPLRRILSWAEEKVFHTETSHAMGLKHHEEDEAFFIHTYASPFIFFVNPFLDESIKFYEYDRRENTRQKRRSMRYYRAVIQRHMFAHPESRYYLSKSPTFSSRASSLLSEYPDARFVYLARNPLDVLPSLMRWFTEVWNSIEKPGIRFPYRDFVVDFVHHWYVDTLKELEKFPSEQVKIVRYDDLVADPFHTVESIYAWLDIEMPGEYREVLSHEKARAKKHWRPKNHSLEVDGFSTSEIYERFKPVFDRFSFSLD